MKTSRIFLTLILAFNTGTSFSAVHLSSDKTGAAIIVPFYTVSNQMNTLLSLNNTTDDNKAVKIHFKEAKNGGILASFNVYLTAQDMWTMATGQIENKIRMISNDQSCTAGFPNNEDIAIEEDWLWENGTIEIIEMGTVGDIEAWQTMENDCEAIAGYWNDNQMWANNSEDQMSSATGGLHAEVTLMDVEQGHSANIPVIHLDGFYDEDNIQHTPAGDATPNLSTGTKDSLLMYDGEVITTTWPTGIEAISALLTTSEVINEYNKEPGVGGKTEWILSFPTLHYHLGSTSTTKPFVKASESKIKFPHGRDGNVTIYSREAHQYYFDRCAGIGTCPGPPTHTIQHAVINMVMIENGYTINPILSNRDQANTLYTDIAYFSYAIQLNGKIKINLNPDTGNSAVNDRGISSSDSQIQHNYHGLPVIGFAYTKFTNANAQPGLLAQYAFVRKHFGKRKVVISEE